MANIFQFLNYRDYLKAFYEEEKARNKAFSFQKMAWKAGFRSKSFFNEVIAGKKNLAPASVFSVGQALGLEGEAFAYFEALVAFNQAKALAERNRWFRHLSGFHKRGKTQMVTRDQFEFYSEWYHNTIRELVTLVDFREDFGLLGRLVKPAISAGKAKDSVKLLLRLGLLVQEKSRYRQADAAITTGEEVKALAIAGFHARNLNLAVESLDTTPAAERDISCLVAGLSEAGFATVKAEIQAFRKKLIGIITHDIPATRVYHINFQVFPTSEKAP